MADLLCEVSNGIAVLTLNRPEVRNALSGSLRHELGLAIERLGQEDGVRVILLTGADPAFCSGVDLNELTSATPQADVGPLAQPIITSRTPLIGAINGAAYTGGLELLLACHFVIASDRATFADTHARLGVTPGWGLSVLLAEAIGSRRAREMILSSQPIDARTAENWGLVNRVVPHDRLLQETVSIASAIAANDPVAVPRLSRLLDDQATVSRAGCWSLEEQTWMGSRVTG